mmetsp:Transcript_148130/g.261246  ORF Transcript_148130/g.261246 Transcript_148130/m.261246 type:complete len:460 (+) Transcript_148130:60-1439(+)
MTTLVDLHDQVLCVIAANLVPTDGFEAPASAWQSAVNFATSAAELHFVVGEILREALPVLATLRPLKDCKRTCWLRTLAALRRMDKGKWRAVRTLQAARPATASFTPIQTSPRLSGASICALGEDTLAVFGGRSSVSGCTLGNTYLVKISWSSSVIAKWDEVVCKDQPGARCYHTAGRFREGMVVFGGAGGDGNTLFNDTWFFKRYNFSLPDGRDCTAACWDQLLPTEGSEMPTARSSHICSAWTRGERLVLHGGIGNAGTMGDTWTLDKSGSWGKMDTSGMHVARAHHIGGVVNDHLLVHSGHGADLLTTKNICALQLCTAVWSDVHWPTGPAPRIDAAASTLDGIGLLIFGGVGADYEFEQTDSWVLPVLHSTRQPQQVATPKQDALLQRACCSMCSDGLRVFMFGGFDGSEDLNDLWCLNLLPACFHDSAQPSQAENADNRCLVLLWELQQRLQGA